jgi:hypothetical protein
MLRTVRVAGRLVELAGLQQVWYGVDHLSRPRITLYYPKGPTKTIDYAYGQWADAKKDLKILEDAKLQSSVHRQAELLTGLRGTGPSDQSPS